ncbi:MAG TPA: hypothetical protein VNZ64_11505 [Candidatus Acidoferrum sp.]|jgi:hypothetical protein|nr:hypothetical protein [Candidatus Acidoferrum sp.]
MIDVALSLLALIAGGVTLELFTTGLTPLELQDERRLGLNAQASEVTEAVQIENPS